MTRKKTGFGARKTGREDLALAIKAHYDAIEKAIDGGNISEIRQINESGFIREMKEVKDYSEMN